MRSISTLVFALVLASGPAWAADSATPPQGVFTSVSGKVRVENSQGKSRDAVRDSAVEENEKIIAGAKASATLKLFDGSELKISSDTSVRISQLHPKGKNDKTIKFKLLLGNLWASVQKLASKKSSFEIEAGGVVCGVRGTQYSVKYEPDKGKVHLNVFEGVVYTHSGKKTQDFPAGSQADFLNGVLKPGNPPPAAQNFDGVMGKFAANDQSLGNPSILTDLLGNGGLAGSLDSGLGGAAQGSGDNIITLPQILIPGLGPGGIDVKGN
jgi:hypothetical protein